MPRTDRIAALGSTKLGLAWRWCATGLVFLFFAISGVFFSLALFPLALAWPHRGSARHAVACIVHAYFRVLVALLRMLGVMRLELNGELRKASRGALVIANHPTWLDVMILLALIPRACCVVKHAHWRNPCFMGIVRAAGYVSNADPVKLVETSAARLREGFSLIVFPEGTRSPSSGGLHLFSRGFAHIALSRRALTEDQQMGAAIVPVLLDCDPPVFTRERRWYHVPPRPFRFRVTVLSTVDERRFIDRHAPPAVAARALADGMRSHISRHLHEHGFTQART